MARAIPNADRITTKGVAVVLVDDRESQRAQAGYFGRSTVTDVISLIYEPGPGGEDEIACELIVNVEQAVRSARRIGHGWTVSDELALYLAHGCDHLSGEEDGTPAQRQRMRRRELRWLRKARRDGLIDDLVAES